MKKINLKNQGFTLVELIIVVAIIAVLATVLAPQYLQYVERTRESNDLQMASNLVDAVIVAVADPSSDLPPGQFVEVLWITGDESGTTTKGSIIIRHNDGWRTSVFNDSDPDKNVLGTSGDINDLKAFADNVFMILDGTTATHIDNSQWWQTPYQDAESTLGNAGNLSFHVNTSTGEIALSKGAVVTADPNRWIELGLNVTPTP